MNLLRVEKTPKKIPILEASTAVDFKSQISQKPFLYVSHI